MPPIHSYCFTNSLSLFILKSLKPIALNELIGQIAKLTGINKLCECIFALAATHSTHSELRQCARESLRSLLPELLNSYLGQNATAAASGLHEISFDLLQYLLCCLKDYVSPQLEAKFLNKLREEFPRDAVPLVLAPLLYRCSTKTTAAVTASTTATGTKSNETDAEEETTNTTTTTSSWSSSDADNNLNEVGIEDIYDHLCEIIFTNQVSNLVLHLFLSELYNFNSFATLSYREKTILWTHLGLI